MIEVWTMQKSVRFLFAGTILVVGFALAVLLMSQRDFAIATLIFSIGLAALVGTGKLASP
ncbi:MAG TPA: hypothetical protein VF043_10295 [Ktedonobacteraceae bacterium]